MDCAFIGQWLGISDEKATPFLNFQAVNSAPCSASTFYIGQLPV